MGAFEFPATPHVRRHGPAGYKNYASYRDWLRDEFTFRCVFCLHRERWYGRSGTFDIDHFVPVAVDSARECEYTNLLYACRTCNTAKTNSLLIADPCEVAFADCLRVNHDGFVEALNNDGKILCKLLRMNSAQNRSYRHRWMQVLIVLEHSQPELFREYMGFPDDLPDLRPPSKRVPENTKPEGIANCYFALRERGVLPDVY